ncbi:MAG: tetratricopeptide repeat protein, partial [Candidatus Bathyarchaeia archaeon]
SSWRQRGNLKKAIEVLQTAVQRYPEQAVLYYDLACYFALAGERERALEALERAIQIDAGLKSLAQKDDDLRSLRGDKRFEELVR